MQELRCTHFVSMEQFILVTVRVCIHVAYLLTLSNPHVLTCYYPEFTLWAIIKIEQI